MDNEKNYFKKVLMNMTGRITANNNLRTSAIMAVAMGIFLPMAETVRRINQILNFSEFFSWFDDYILGALLLASGYLVFKKAENAVAYLIAAWGIATGALFLSFLGQFSYYASASGDPGIFSTTFVAVAKGLILIYMIFGLAKAIKAFPKGYSSEGHPEL